MKRPLIVALDGHPLNPGDLEWKPIEALGELKVYPRSTPDEAVERAAGADILIVNKVVIREKELSALPDLKYVGITATGYNNIDTEAFKKHSVLASNVPDYGSFGVAQHAMALLLSLSNRVYYHFQDVLEGKWFESGDFSYTSAPIIELAEKKIGLVGLGKIGYKMGVMAESMGMYVGYYSRSARQSSWEFHEDLQSLLETSDVISLHVPLTEDTHEIINARTLSMMKKGAILVNTSRGQLINENDLLHALESRQIAGAGLDVLTEEPPAVDHPLVMARNCIVTPHNAWASRESRQRIMDILAGNIRSFLDGNPVNLV